MDKTGKIFINQAVDKEAYKIIKVIATLKGKKIQDIINEALIFYSEANKISLKGEKIK